MKIILDKGAFMPSRGHKHDPEYFCADGLSDENEL